MIRLWDENQGSGLPPRWRGEATEVASGETAPFYQTSGLIDFFSRHCGFRISP